MNTLDIVVAGYIVNNGKLLLIHHKQLDKWLPVGGHLHKNETPDDALVREAKEELGIVIDFFQYPKLRRGNKRQYASPFYQNLHHITENHLHYCLFYLCKLKTRNIRCDPNESKGYGWFRSEDLPKIQPPLNEGAIITCLEAIKLAENL